MNIPVIELYEYQIHKYYPEDRFSKVDPQMDDKTREEERIKNLLKQKAVFKFGDIDDSPIDECKRIAIDGMQSNTDSDTNRSTCDPIYSSLTGGKAYYDIDNLYGNYKLFLAKDINVNELDTDSKKKLLQNLDNVIDKQYNMLNNNMHSSMIILFGMIDYLRSKPKFNKRDNEDLYQQADETAIIQTLNVSDETKIILFGDFHGSYHTFFRNLCRLHRYGVIDLNTFEIKDPYKIIFLGDILDRGMYSLDIINVIFKLMIKNNTENEQKIIYNRGNHENYDQYLWDNINGKINSQTSANEFSTKINDTDITNEFITKLNLLFCLLPSAVIINNQDKQKIWCSHGGFPNNLEITDDIFVLIDDTAMSKDIRWSDFGIKDMTNSKAYLPSSRDGFAGNLKTFTHKGTMDFLERNNIDFIIRGHQDSYANSAFCSSTNDDTQNNFINLAEKNFPDVEDIIINNNGSKTFGSRVVGPIARVIADKDNYDVDFGNNVKIYPVLTISTNTDNGRYLNSDSFALLRFDIQPDDINKFDKNILSILQNIKDILRNETINKDIIIKKNIDTIEKFLLIFNDETNLKLCKIHLMKKEKLNDDRIKEINIQILSLYYDISDIFLYYESKIKSLKQKITDLFISEKLLSYQNDLLQLFIKELEEKFNNCLSMSNKLNKLDVDKFTDAEIIEIIKNNRQNEILEKLNIIMKEIIQ